LRRYLKAKTGVSFLEVLAALIILSVALVPIMTWVPTSIQTKVKSERKTTAIFLAQGKIEELRCQIIGNFTQDRNPPQPVAFPNPYQNFSYTVSDDLNPNLKTISVRVWHIEKPNDETILYTKITKR